MRRVSSPKMQPLILSDIFFLKYSAIKMTNVTISLQLTSCSPDGEWQSGLKEHITKIIIILSFSSPLHLSLCHSSCSAWVAPLLQIS